MIALLVCVAIGTLLAISAYLLMSKRLLDWLIGASLFGAITNLVIFILPLRGAQGLVREDPLSQALILTSIVISFGLSVFGLVLIRQVSKSFNVWRPISEEHVHDDD